MSVMTGRQWTRQGQRWHRQTIQDLARQYWALTEPELQRYRESADCWAVRQCLGLPAKRRRHAAQERHSRSQLAALAHQALPALADAPAQALPGVFTLVPAAGATAKDGRLELACREVRQDSTRAAKEDPLTTKATVNPSCSHVCTY